MPVDTLSATGPLGGRLILLVEDEYLIAEEMRGWLDRAGANVLGPMPGTKEAFAALDGLHHPPDAAVLDINLGHDDAVYPLADWLHTLHVPFLFVTGTLRHEHDPSYGSSHLLEKPVTQRDLLAALSRLLGPAPIRA